MGQGVGVGNRLLGQGDARWVMRGGSHEVGYHMRWVIT